MPFQAFALTDNEGPDESIDSILLKEIDVDLAVKNAIVDSFLDEANFELLGNDTIVLSKHYIQVVRPQNDGSIQSSFLTATNENGPADFENIAKELTRTTYSSGSYTIPYHNIELGWGIYHIQATFTCDYKKAVNWEGYRFYQPYRLSTSWKPISGNTVTNLRCKVQYDSHGELIQSPACLDTNNTYNDLVALVVDDYYTESVVIDKTGSYLAANTVVYHTNVWDYDYAIWFSNGYFSGSSIGYEYWYTCNGNSKHVSYYSFSLGTSY